MRTANDEREKARLAFVLGQLRDDLEELIAALNDGALSPDQARAGAEVQLSFTLDALVAKGGQG